MSYCASSTVSKQSAQSCTSLPSCPDASSACCYPSGFYRNNGFASITSVNEPIVDRTEFPCGAQLGAGSIIAANSVLQEGTLLQSGDATPALVLPAGFSFGNADFVVPADGLVVSLGTVYVPAGATVPIPNSGAGTVILAEDFVLPAGVTYNDGTTFPPGSTLPAGTVLDLGGILTTPGYELSSVVAAEPTEIESPQFLPGSTVSAGVVFVDGATITGTVALPVTIYVDSPITLVTGGVLAPSSVLATQSLLAAGSILPGGAPRAPLLTGDAPSFFPRKIARGKCAIKC